MDILLSDIHANLHALRAVLRVVRKRRVDRFVLLGDLTGYGAQPEAVIARVRGLEPRFAVRGNHDRACIDGASDRGFSLPARQAAAWTRERLDEASRTFLRALRPGPVSVGGDYLIAHGSPDDEGAYLLHPGDAALAFREFEGGLCFFGHTHIPGLFELEPGAREPRWIVLEPGRPFDLKADHRYLVNPGSVGQPRDRDPRASCMSFDPLRRRLRLHRVAYDADAAGAAILAAGLHASLATRLSHGF